MVLPVGKQRVNTQDSGNGKRIVGSRRARRRGEAGKTGKQARLAEGVTSYTGTPQRQLRARPLLN